MFFILRQAPENAPEFKTVYTTVFLSLPNIPIRYIVLEESQTSGLRI